MGLMRNQWPYADKIIAFYAQVVWMDRLKAMATFVRIADCGSLTAAAEALSQSPASVVRSLAALERHLGVRLMNRTTRRLALTAEGAEYLNWCRRMLAEFDVIENRMEASRKTPGGILRLTAPVEFGNRYVTPVVNGFLRAWPGMTVELILLDRMVDLLEEGLDLALRIGQLPDSTIMASALGRTRPVIVASPAFLAENGPIDHPQALRDMACVAFMPFSSRWDFRLNGQQTSVQLKPRLSTNHVQAALQAAEDGLGVMRALHYQVADALAEGRLIRILKNCELPDLPVQFARPHNRLISPRVRHFMDWAAPRLSAAIPDPC